MGTRDFNPQRLTVARLRRGFTKVGLAEELDLSSRTIGQYENGRTVPSDRTLKRIAECLGFPLAFFFADDLELPSVDATSFRALSKMSARERERARSAAGLAYEVASWVQERFTLPVAQLPRFEGDPEADYVADAVRREWRLGEHPISNMLRLLEAKGVRVFAVPTECVDTDAFSSWHDDQPYVFLDTKKSAERRRFDAAHELGHLVMHWQGITRSRETERFADDFASAFLMPMSSVFGNRPRNSALPTLIDAKKIWGVSVAALVVRLHRLELLTDWEYRTLFIQISRLGYRSNEPAPMPAEVSEVWPKVFGLLRDDGCSLSDVAREVLLDPQDLRGLVTVSRLVTVASENVSMETTEQVCAAQSQDLRVIEGYAG